MYYRNRIQHPNLRDLSTITATKLLEVPIDSVSTALEFFGQDHGPGNVPLILRPKNSIFSLFCTIPTGVAAIATSYGKIIGEQEPGFFWTPPWKKIKWIINKQHIPYDYPVKECPTLDNVKVYIDTLVVFRIVKAEQFLTTFGPYKLQDTLASFLEESIRALARQTTYDKVYDLRGKNSDMVHMQRSLNDKLEKFGVVVDQITITNIGLPNELQTSLQNTTTFISKEREHTKSHNYNIIVEDNKNTLEMERLRNANERLKVNEQHAIYLKSLKKEVDEINSITKKRLAEINAEAECEKRAIIIKAEKEEAKLTGEKNKFLSVTRAEGAKKAAVIKQEVENYCMIRSSEKEKACSENRAKALSLIADAEEKASKSMRAKREYILQQKELQVIEALSKNSKIVVSGSTDYLPVAQMGAFSHITPMIPHK